MLDTVTGLPVSRKQLKGPKILPGRLYQRKQASRHRKKADRAEASLEASSIANLDAWERSKLGTVMGDESANGAGTEPSHHQRQHQRRQRR